MNLGRTRSPRPYRDKSEVRAAVHADYEARLVEAMRDPAIDARPCTERIAVVIARVLAPAARSPDLLTMLALTAPVLAPDVPAPRPRVRAEIAAMIGGPRRPSRGPRARRTSRASVRASSPAIRARGWNGVSAGDACANFTSYGQTDWKPSHPFLVVVDSSRGRRRSPPGR